MLQEFLVNLSHNLFKPLLLFFYAGFLIPLLRVKFEFPKAVYQGLTIYLLLGIGWHGGEELAGLPASAFKQALGFMVLGFFTNLVIGIAAYQVLIRTTRLRKVDAATVAGYYGSDSAGTFVTATGVLAASQIAFAPYMPVMLAVMEIPGCLVALYLVSKFRSSGMDKQGNMPGEAGYQKLSSSQTRSLRVASGNDHDDVDAKYTDSDDGKLAGAYEADLSTATGRGSDRVPVVSRSSRSTQPLPSAAEVLARHEAESAQAMLALESSDPEIEIPATDRKSKSFLTPAMLHEVFLNPGIFLLFAGVAIGFCGRLQGEKVTAPGDALFSNLFQGVLCLFLLEMGMTAASKLKDLKTAGWQFVAFGLIGPNLFAGFGMLMAHGYSKLLGVPFDVGTYVLFAVLCGAASYIALPAVQRMAIPEASPTLPLASSLGVTFSYNVTIGIPVYMMAAKLLTTTFPVIAG